MNRRAARQTDRQTDTWTNTDGKLQTKQPDRDSAHEKITVDHHSSSSRLTDEDSLHEDSVSTVSRFSSIHTLIRRTTSADPIHPLLRGLGANAEEKATHEQDECIAEPSSQELLPRRGHFSANFATEVQYAYEVQYRQIYVPMALWHTSRSRSIIDLL